jgi:hypothetical protein
MAVIPASQMARRRLTIASRRLGTRNPIETIGGLLDRSFDLPLGDPRYRANSLTPGAMPLEHSFSELMSNSLRIDLEPLGPGASPHARQQEVGREMRRIVPAYFGKPALRWFDERSEPWRSSRIHGTARFGAWFGGAFDPSGMQEAKAYYELGPDQLNDLPPTLRHVARVAMDCLPGLVPVFTSIACGRDRGAQRIYFFHRGELRLLDLEQLMRRLGIGQQLPSLLSAVGLVLGGRFILPEGSVILGLRDTQRGIEMKLDVLVAGVPDPPPQMHDLLNLVLAERPQSQRALRHWMQAMTPDDRNTPGDISVTSFRVRSEGGARVSVYLRPVGYDAQPSRARPDVDPYQQLAI